MLFRSIERNLSLRHPCQNPAITSASRNKPEMMRYWLQKQSQLFAGEPEYLQQLFYAAIRVASMFNQYNTPVTMAQPHLGRGASRFTPPNSGGISNRLRLRKIYFINSILSW